jgi:hypothetical protein
MRTRPKQTDLDYVFDTYPENEGNFRRLGEDIDSSTGIVPFVGAGLSIPLGFPSWRDFLLAQAARANVEAEIRDLLEQGEFEEAAERLLNELRPQAFNDSLDDAFGDHKLDSRVSFEAASLIPLLTTGPVITTNFDHVLEKAFASSGRPFERVAWGAKADLLAKAFTQKQRLLLKIHGDVDDRLERVLTLKEYRRNYERPGRIRRLLAQIFSSRPVLFIGCSLSVDRVVTVLAKTARSSALTSHYAVIEAPENEEHFRAKARFLSDNKIQPIWYPHGRHECVASLITSLIQQDSSKGVIAASSLLDMASPDVAQAIAKGDSPREAATKVFGYVTDWKSVTHRFGIAGHEGRIILSFSDDGFPAELVVLLRKEGSLVAGLLACFSEAITIGLSFGVPAKRFCDEFSHMQFEPTGWTGTEGIGYAKSICDYVFRWLSLQLGDREKEGPAGLRDPRTLPAECASVSHSFSIGFSIGEQPGTVTVMLFEDSNPGAVQVALSKAGPTVTGLMNGWAAAVSLNLQHGVPLSVMCEAFAHTRFEPSGWSGNDEIGYAKSLIDYIARWINLRFLSATALKIF